jgi:hypothetical protein
MNVSHGDERPNLPHRVSVLTRRDMLIHSGGGFGALALAYLLGCDESRAGGSATPGRPANDVSAPWRRPARAKNVVFLFMDGGPSHIDLFDRKPELNVLAGKPLPPSFKPVITPMGEADGPLLASPRRWAQHGESGLWISDWLPQIAGCADDLAVIRSCWSNGLNHVGGVCQMNTGSILAGRPSLGSWVSYGLGSENQDLPAFVVLTDSESTVPGGPRNWGSGFMPAVYQATRLHGGAEPIPNLRTPVDVGEGRQRSKLDLIRWLDRSHAEARCDQTELDARIQSYELAFRMQAEAPEAVDLAQESVETHRLYGLDREETRSFGRNCLLARRLVERGVRFVQLYNGAGSKWDSHRKIETRHAALCLSMDRPVAGLLKDLKRRGLLETTLVVWGGEFGRTPMSEGGDGRDHNPYGFTMWMAGGGIPGGRGIGATDSVGLHAVEDRLHVHDIHATILHLLGVDHTRLVYRHRGRPERPTVNEGEVSWKITG